MQLHTLLAQLKQPQLACNQLSEQHRQTVVTGLTYDSRSAQAGCVFFAVPGTHTDGRRYLPQVAAQGALLAIGEALDDFTLPPQLAYIEVANVRLAMADLAAAFYNHPGQRLCTIGVTGTDGKTTTSNLIASLFEYAGKCTGLMTTANLRLNGKEWENPYRQSTLESLQIQEFLSQLVEQEGTHAIIEATSHGLALQKVEGVGFDVGVVTNITHEHLDFHQTLENYRRAKAHLFELVDPQQSKEIPRHPIAILNRDDSSFAYLQPFCQVPILDYGIDTPAAVRAVDLELGARKTRFRLLVPDGEAWVETPLVGRFNVSNCLAAIAVAYSQGIPLETIVGGLSQVKGVAGRMETIDEGQAFSVLVDYAHTSYSLGIVLSILRPLTSGKLIAVFGSAGERDTQKRPEMGKIAAQIADYCIFTDEDPREEDRDAILADIAAGARAVGKQEEQDFFCRADREDAIRLAFGLASSGDTVLLAGKGHEQSIIIGRTKVPWDDRRVARKILQETGNP